jgi:hypothetical protein
MLPLEGPNKCKMVLPIQKSRPIESYLGVQDEGMDSKRKTRVSLGQPAGSAAIAVTTAVRRLVRCSLLAGRPLNVATTSAGMLNGRAGPGSLGVQKQKSASDLLVGSGTLLCRLRV